MPADASAVENLLFDLDSELDEVRRAAVFAAATTDNVKVVHKLTEMAGKDPSIEIRFIVRKLLHALAAKARTGGTPVKARKSAGITKRLTLEGVPVITYSLSSPSDDVRASAYRAAAMTRDPALLPGLLQRIPPEVETDSELRSMLVRVIAMVGGKDQTKAVSRFLQDPDSRCRATAVEVLGEFRDVTTFALIVGALQDPDNRVMTAAITALQSVGAINLLKVCSLMLRSDQYWARDSACYCLGAARLPESIPILKEALTDSYEGVRIKAKKALMALAQLGHATAKEAVAQATAVKEHEAPEDFMKLSELSASLSRTDIAQDLRSSEVKARRKATGQLTALGVVDVHHLPMLLSQLDQETDPTALAHLVSAVALAGGEETVPSMKKFASHSDSRVRAALADAMAKIATSEALALVRPLLRDPDATVVAHALMALAQDPAVDVDRAVEAMVSHKEALHRRMAIFVITELELERLAPFLEKLAHDDDGAVAGMARQAQKIARGARRPAPAPGAAPAPPPATGPAPAAPAGVVSGSARTPIQSIAPPAAEADDDSIASFTALWGPGPQPPQTQPQPPTRPSLRGQVLRPSVGIPRVQVDAVRGERQGKNLKIGAGALGGLLLIFGMVRLFSGSGGDEVPAEKTSAATHGTGRSSARPGTPAGHATDGADATSRHPPSVGSRLDVEGKVLSVIPTGCLLRVGGRILLLQGGDSQRMRVGSHFKGWGTVTQIEPGGMVHLNLTH
jgi:HEAT repeat protein